MTKRKIKNAGEIDAALATPKANARSVPQHHTPCAPAAKCQAAFRSPEGAPQCSPGQRPGFRTHTHQALKGRPKSKGAPAA